MEVVVIALIAFAGIVAFRLSATAKGWRIGRQWRSKTSWRDLPVGARLLLFVCVVGGLAGGALLATATSH